MTPLTWVGLAILAAVLLWLADRGLRAAEARGWIYYRRRSASGSVSAAAFGPAFDLLQPTRQTTVEQAEHDRIAPAELPREDR